VWCFFSGLGVVFFFFFFFCLFLEGFILREESLIELLLEFPVGDFGLFDFGFFGGNFLWSTSLLLLFSLSLGLDEGNPGLVLLLLCEDASPSKDGGIWIQSH